MECLHSVDECPCCFKRELQRLLPGAVCFEKDAEGHATIKVLDLETCIKAYLQATGIDIRHLVDDESSELSE
ncbi:MAG: hypothetical protein CMP20_15895 [Rickettsiales bacterium]|nr:hypothetical protein [Rickettsiales bacterium]